MKFLPFYKEENRAKFSGAISLAKNRNILKAEDAHIIADYMSSCIVVDEWLSNTQDVLTNEYIIPSQTWSDGVYVWSASHIYYVKTYRVHLPDRFILHVKKQLAKGVESKKINKGDLISKFQVALKKIAYGDESFISLPSSAWGCLFTKLCLTKPPNFK